MDEPASDRYEEWDLLPLVMPARSTLYALEPMGVGTAFGESLTSYLTRVASAHCVFPGDLIRTMMVPLALFDAAASGRSDPSKTERLDPSQKSVVPSMLRRMARNSSEHL